MMRQRRGYRVKITCVLFKHKWMYGYWARYGSPSLCVKMCARCGYTTNYRPKPRKV